MANATADHGTALSLGEAVYHSDELSLVTLLTHPACFILIAGICWTPSVSQAKHAFSWLSPIASSHPAAEKKPATNVVVNEERRTRSKAAVPVSKATSTRMQELNKHYIGQLSLIGC